MSQTRADAPTDAALMKRLAAGDMGALGELYLRYGPLVGHAVIAATPSVSRHDMEDVCQDVFMNVARSAKRYKEEGRFKSWLYSVAVRVAKRRHRAQTLHQRLLGAVKGRPIAVSGPRSMLEANVMSRMDLYRAFEGLTDIQRQILVMFELQGMSGEEVSSTLGIKLNTVWSHLRRARDRLLVEFDESQEGRGNRK